MEFVFDTAYGQKATAVMAHVLRKTVRRKHSRRSHIFGWIVLVFAVFITLPIGGRVFVWNFKTILTYLAALVLFFALVFEDSINGYVARKRMLKGTERARVTFREDGYYSETEIGNTEWTYDKITMLAETRDYFVFLFSPSHAQVYDKQSIAGGTAEQFRAFIEEKAQKKIYEVR